MLKSNTKGSPPAIWETFSKNQALCDANQVSKNEMRFLARVARLGSIKSERDLINVLHVVRNVLDSTVSGPSRIP